MVVAEEACSVARGPSMKTSRGELTVKDGEMYLDGALTMVGLPDDFREIAIGWVEPRPTSFLRELLGELPPPPRRYTRAFWESEGITYSTNAEGTDLQVWPPGWEKRWIVQWLEK